MPKRGFDANSQRWDSNTKVPAPYAIGMGPAYGGFKWGGGFEDDVRETRFRNAMPAPSDTAEVSGVTRLDQRSPLAIRATVSKATFSTHGEPGGLRPLHCLAFEPARGGSNARILAGASDGWVLRLRQGRRVCAAWRAHDAAVTALTFAGGGVFAAATAGDDGYVRLWALSKPAAESGNVLGGHARGCETTCQQLVGEWYMRGAGLGTRGPRQCLASIPSRVGKAADFDLVLLSGYGLHQLSIHRPRVEAADTAAERWLFGSVYGEEEQEAPAWASSTARAKTLDNGWVAEATPRCLLQGHRAPCHLLLAHPATQRVITVDATTACVWDCDASAATLESALSTTPFDAASKPRNTLTLPSSEGAPCCAVFSPSGGRWAVGLESGSALLVDEDPAEEEATASRVGKDSSGALRTLLQLPPLSPPVPLYPEGAPRPHAAAVVSMTFNPEEDVLAIATSLGVVAVHGLPRTNEQQRRRRVLLEIRSHVPQPVAYGGFGEEEWPRKVGACLLPLTTPRIASLVFSPSSAHVFAVAPAGTAAAAIAIRANGDVEHVHDGAVGAAEWPKAISEAAASAASLCDAGALLAGRFHPVRRGQKLPLREFPRLAPTADLESKGGDGSQYGRPHRKPVLSKRPKSIGERLREAAVGGGIAAVGGQLGRLDVHSGLQWTTRAHESTHEAAATPVVAHVAWTAGERLAITGDSHQPCLCVWEQRS